MNLLNLLAAFVISTQPTQSSYLEKVDEFSKQYIGKKTIYLVGDVNHFSQKAQNQAALGLTKLIEKEGIKLLGAEGFEGELAYPKQIKRAEIKKVGDRFYVTGDSIITAGSLAESKFKENLLTLGVDDTSSTSSIILGQLEQLREEKVISNLVKAMESSSYKKAALYVGAEHLKDLAKALDKKKVNYICFLPKGALSSKEKDFLIYGYDKMFEK